MAEQAASVVDSLVCDDIRKELAGQLGNYLAERGVVRHHEAETSDKYGRPGRTIYDMGREPTGG